MLSRITPIILTYNESPNIGRTLDSLKWAQDIVVVDSGSTDGTTEVVARHPQARLFERPFTTHAEQWNFALTQTKITTEWVLALDADYQVPAELTQEIATLTPDTGTAGYRARFQYCIDGRPLRGAAYPPVVVLFRRAAAVYVQDGHTQRVQLQGRVLPLSASIRHDDRKPIEQWLAAQVRYMRLEAEKLRCSPMASLNLADRLRRLVVFAPVAMAFYCLVVRGGVLDGRAGLLYALQRTTAETILSLYLLAKGGRRGC
jgi:glycosyltransferase involved in cell wall biosynthesis